MPTTVNLSYCTIVNNLEYTEFIFTISVSLQFASIFVTSDTANVIDMLRQLRPDLNFLSFIKTDADSLEGHLQNRFNELSLQLKRLATYKLMAELEVLAQAKYVVCTFSSNICRLVQILRNAHTDTVLSLDGKWVHH